MPIADLTRSSPAIVLGSVTGLAGAVTADGRLVTLVDLAVDTVVRGSLRPGPVTLREPGGRVGGFREVVDGTPDFHVGERVLAFLTTWPDGSLRANHLALGAYFIDLDAAGQLRARLRFRPGATVVLTPGAASPTAPTPLRDLLDAVTHALPAGPAALPGPAPLSVPPEAATAEPYDEVSDQFVLAGPARHFQVDEGTPLKYVLDANGDATLGFCGVRGALLDAFAAWTGAGSNLALTDGGQTFDLSTPCPGPSKVLFNDPFGEIPDPVGCTGVLGVGGFCTTSLEKKVFGSTSFDRALRARYVLANGWGACSEWTLCNVAEISTHEIGHSIGLGHSADSDATMFATAHFDGRCATVKTDDAAGVTFIYPTSIPPTVTTPNPLPAATAGVPYSKPLAAIGGTGPYSWVDVSGVGFPGLSLSPAGVISGTPGAFGSGYFQAKATDALGDSHTKKLDIEVLLPGSTTSTTTSTTSTSTIVCAVTTTTTTLVTTTTTILVTTTTTILVTTTTTTLVTTTTTILVTTTTTTLVTTTTTIQASVGHLKCYKTKDARAKALYTADLLANVAGFPDELGCRVSVGAKQICVEVDKQNVSPTPPGGGPAAPPNAGSVFLSYKIKCPKVTVPPATLVDQFGPTTLTVGAAKELLVPALPGPANDHFKCYKAKDPRPKASYTADLLAGVAGFTDELGCTIKLGGKYVCVQVTKQNVTPSPPGGGPGAGPGSGAKFIRYKLKCPKGALPPVGATDQFGSGTFTPGSAKTLLVPAS
jgi:Matrixin